jgi:hypothetical protein
MVDDLTQRDDVQELDKEFTHGVISSQNNDADLFVAAFGSARCYETRESHARQAVDDIDTIEYAYSREAGNGHYFNVVDDGESRLEALEDALDMVYVSNITQLTNGYYRVIPSDEYGFLQNNIDLSYVRDVGFEVHEIQFTHDVEHVIFKDTEVEE